MKDRVDLLKLYAKGSNNGWNEFLNECFDNQDSNRLARMRRALQVGMDDLVKKKLNNDAIDIWFLRLQKSIENTIVKISRFRNPNPFDKGVTSKDADPKLKSLKKSRDKDVEDFLKKSGF